MNAKDLIAAGRLSDARTRLTAEVKAAPSDVAKRTLLFQVLAFLGEWEKAGRHLDMIVTLNPRSETGVQVYRNMISAEKERSEVMERKRIPGFASSAPTYLEAYLVAWDKLNERKPTEARRLYRQIEKQRGPVSGSEAWDALPLHYLASLLLRADHIPVNLDPRLGPRVQGDYHVQVAPRLFPFSEKSENLEKERSLGHVGRRCLHFGRELRPCL